MSTVDLNHVEFGFVGPTRGLSERVDQARHVVFGHLARCLAVRRERYG